MIYSCLLYFCKVSPHGVNQNCYVSSHPNRKWTGRIQPTNFFTLTHPLSDTPNHISTHAHTHVHTLGHLTHWDIPQTEISHTLEHPNFPSTVMSATLQILVGIEIKYYQNCTWVPTCGTQTSLVKAKWINFFYQSMQTLFECNHTPTSNFRTRICFMIDAIHFLNVWSIDRIAFPKSITSWMKSNIRSQSCLHAFTKCCARFYNLACSTNHFVRIVYNRLVAQTTLVMEACRRCANTAKFVDNFILHPATQWRPDLDCVSAK